MVNIGGKLLQSYQHLTSLILNTNNNNINFMLCASAGAPSQSRYHFIYLVYNQQFTTIKCYHFNGVHYSEVTEQQICLPDLNAC
jgi:hypothetical protein